MAATAQIADRAGQQRHRHEKAAADDGGRRRLRRTGALARIADAVTHMARNMRSDKAMVADFSGRR